MFDGGADGVVCSNPGKTAVDPAEMYEFGASDRFDKHGNADSGIEIHRIAGFWPKAKGGIRSRNNSG